MKTFIKNFQDLSNTEIYQILRLRSEVFVVEQECIYQDIDNKDKKAVHIFLKEKNEIIAYSRVFKEKEYFENPSIGRVVVANKRRMYGVGKKIMNISIDYIKQNIKAKSIEISAQKYLKKFYSNLGFIQEGDEYLEDNIPHLRMFLII
jgi:ElaA protein